MYHWCPVNWSPGWTSEQRGAAQKLCQSFQQYSMTKTHKSLIWGITYTHIIITVCVILKLQISKSLMWRSKFPVRWSRSPWNFYGNTLDLIIHMQIYKWRQLTFQAASSYFPWNKASSAGCGKTKLMLKFITCQLCLSFNFIFPSAWILLFYGWISDYSIITFIRGNLLNNNSGKYCWGMMAEGEQVGRIETIPSELILPHQLP